MWTSRRILNTIAICSAATMVVLANQPLSHAQTTTESKPQSEHTEMKTIQGEFDVNIVPVEGDDPTMGQMKLDKQYHGALDAKGVGTMLTGMTAVQGSAAYVAIERVDGTLEGKKGTFLIHHRGIMTRGEPTLEVLIVPDSGTEELSGITGSMTIDIRNDKHFYELNYRIVDDSKKPDIRLYSLATTILDVRH
ncbi:MAG: DUF3224 domain-containing protein [Pirellulaceae bacterium]